MVAIAMDRDSSPRPSPPAVLAAWSVHALTASGAVFAVLALLAIERLDWTMAMWWLGAALAVDGIDGTLARWARVKQRAPRIDGATLDLVVDYLNYVFVPTVLIWKAELIPAALAPLLAALIQLSALYVFARADMKTDDNYFRGFPALWNVAAFYLFVTGAGQSTGAVLVTTLVVASFAPIHFIHPFRVRDYGSWPALLAIAWAGGTALLLWPDLGSAGRTAALSVSVGSAALLILLGLVRTVRGARPAP